MILKLKNTNRDRDINKIVISNIVSFVKKGFNYFIGYKNANKI